jgi:hypothetical protein
MQIGKEKLLWMYEKMVESGTGWRELWRGDGAGAL